MTTNCELVDTYEVLEHVMGIKGLHPHRLATVRNMRIKLIEHVINANFQTENVVLDIGCGSGAGTRELAMMFVNNQKVIGLDINRYAIESARNLHGDVPNLSFYHGDLASFMNDKPGVKISAVMCVSVSMFVRDVNEFYRQIQSCLLDGGIFIDAPFMFRSPDEPEDKFRSRTYAVCGCDMKMFNLPQLKSIFRDAGFANVDGVEHDFELMDLPLLFEDYPARYLLGNFLKNVFSPPAYFGEISSRYLFSRTLRIFIFFLRNRRRYASGEILAVRTNITGRKKHSFHVTQIEEDSIESVS